MAKIVILNPDAYDSDSDPFTLLAGQSVTVQAIFPHGVSSFSPGEKIALRSVGSGVSLPVQEERDKAFFPIELTDSRLHFVLATPGTFFMQRIRGAIFNNPVGVEIERGVSGENALFFVSQLLE